MAHLGDLAADLEAIFRRPPTDAEVAAFTAIGQDITIEEVYRVAVDDSASDTAHTVIKFYQVFYGRLPDLAGLNFWVEQVDNGLSLNELADFFATASEFDERFGDRTPTEIVFAQYRNVLGREPDFAGLTFWTTLVNDGDISIADLGRFFATSDEFMDRADPLIDAFLINEVSGDGNEDADTLFDVVEGNGVVEANGVVTSTDAVGNPLRVDLALNSSAGATSASGSAAGAAGALTVLRLTGDASARIDFTDSSSQLEQLDLNGNGEIEVGTPEFNVRDSIPVSNFEIIDAHPRDGALLDPSNTITGYTGDLLFDGTGFDGDGVASDGNIVLAGYGNDILFGGIGNDFFSPLAGGGEVKGSRNADFIYQELSTLDEAFVNQGFIDGGTTFDDDPLQDNDWLLLEASDDEEPIDVTLNEAGSPVDGSFGDDEDVFGGVSSTSTRLNNDRIGIADIENLNASGNFYKFLNISNEARDFNAAQILAFDDDVTVVDYRGLEGFTVRLTGATFSVTVNPGSTLTQIIAATNAAINAAGITGLVVSAEPDTKGEASGQVLTITDTQFLTRDFLRSPTVVGQSPSGSDTFNQRTELVPVVSADPLFGDVFFGDNRDFSQNAVEHRVPGLSPGVTGQIRVEGSVANNTVIAGYDNDYVDGNQGDDLLFGGDLEFLLTHRHNANLFDLNGAQPSTISVNGQDGLADDGRDTLLGGEGNDSLVWEADRGTYDGGTNGGTDGDDDIGGGDTLWLTTFSTGRTTDTVRSTDGSEARFLAVDGAGTQASQDLTGIGESADEAAAASVLTTDGVLRFDLAGWTGYGGSDVAGQVDQTNYRAAFSSTTVTNIENIDASGLGAIDYLAAGTNDPDLNFENQQNYRAANTDLQLLGTGGMNILRGGFGDDEIEGRGNMDIMSGNGGDDTFFGSLNPGDNVGFNLPLNGDGVDVIERVLDRDGDGIADDADGDGAADVGQDFRADSTTTTTVTNIPAMFTIGISDETENVSWTQFEGVVLRFSTGRAPLSITLDQQFSTASQVAQALQAALNAEGLGAIVVTAPAGDVKLTFPGTFGVNDASAAINTPVGQVGGFDTAFMAGGSQTTTTTNLEDDKLVFRSYQDRADGESVPDLDASLGIDAYANDLVVGFTSEGTVIAEEQEFCIKLANLKDNDTISIQVNGNAYTIEVGFDDITGTNVTGETTAQAAARLVDLINATIEANPTSRDGALVASFDRENTDPGKVSQLVNDFGQPFDPENTVTFYLRQDPSEKDGEEHVFMNTPIVNVGNQSGGERPGAEVIDISQSSILLRDYDGRPESENLSTSNTRTDFEGAQGLNTGFEAEEDRDDGRFVTFEDLSGENRAVLQTANGEGDPGAGDGGTAERVARNSGLEGSEVLTFSNGAKTVEDLTPLEKIDEDNTIDAEWLEEVDLIAPFTNPGNGNINTIGQPTVTVQSSGSTFAALHGDDLLIGSDLGEVIDGQTGDDRVIGSISQGLTGNAVDFVFGGRNILINGNGRIYKEADGDLVQDVADLAVNNDDDDGNDITADRVGLLQFTDTLIFEQGTERNEITTDINGNPTSDDFDRFEESAQFFVNVTGFSEDGGLEGQVRIDNNGDGDVADIGIDGITNFYEFENVVVYSDNGTQTLNLADLNGVVLGDDGDADDGGIFFDNDSGALTVLRAVTDDDDDDDDDDGDGFVEVGVGCIEGLNTFTLTGGNDTFNGDAGSERINAGAGNDVVFGNDGNDVLNGGDGADALDGGDDQDRINGGTGDDILTGGDDEDVFAFIEVRNDDGDLLTGDDTITDFVSGEDQIDLRDFDLDFGDVTSAAGSIEVDTDNDGTTDFTITLANGATAAEDDFIF